MRIRSATVLGVLFGLISSVASAQIVETMTGPFSASGGVSVDPAGNIVVANFGATLQSGGGATVYKVTPNGTVTLFANGLNGASGNTFDTDGNLYQSNINLGVVSKITPDGTVSTFSTGHNSPVGVVVDPNTGDVLVSRSGHSVYEVSLEGAVTVLAGTGQRGKADGSALDATFSFPNGIGASPSGDTLYVNDVLSTVDVSTNLNPIVMRRIILSQNTDVEGSEAEVPRTGVLDQNYPNPFSGGTTLRFRLAQPRFVTLTVYDVFGREVATLVHGRKAAGSYTVPFDGRGLPAGVFFYRLQRDAFTETRPMMVVR